MKRSDRFAQSNDTYQRDMREPHYNTYYQPVGKPPKKKKSKRIFLRILIILTIIIVLFLGLMYFMSSRANVDDLKSIENKK